jgi:hypothetical protein
LHGNHLPENKKKPISNFLYGNITTIQGVSKKALQF